MTDQLFRFQPRWKEELVVSGNGGSFVLEMPMGRLSALLPTQAEWELRAPEWAQPLWGMLKLELEEWCRENNAHFYVDPTADVYPL